MQCDPLKEKESICQSCSLIHRAMDVEFTSPNKYNMRTVYVRLRHSTQIHLCVVFIRSAPSVLLCLCVTRKAGGPVHYQRTMNNKDHPESSSGLVHAGIHHYGA